MSKTTQNHIPVSPIREAKKSTTARGVGLHKTERQSPREKGNVRAKPENSISLTGLNINAGIDKESTSLKAKRPTVQKGNISINKSSTISKVAKRKHIPLKGSTTGSNLYTYPQKSGTSHPRKMEHPSGRNVQDGRSHSQSHGPSNEASRDGPSGAHGYHNLGANVNKRQQIQQRAQQETDAYNRYKEETKIKHVSYSGSTGGQLSMAEVRAKQFSDHRQSSVKKRLNEQARKEQVRRQEQEVFDRRKLEARKKQEENTRREDERQGNQRRKGYEQFLQRLEGNNEFGSERRQESEREQEDYNDAMIKLLELFPHCDAPMLKEILIQNNGDTEKVQRLLLGD